MYTFVTGGYRSGRSNYALKRASELAHPPWLYVATGSDTDEAIQKRIAKYRRDSEAIWRTMLMPPRLLDLVEPSALEGFGAAVFDGLPSWIEQQLKAGDGEANKRILKDIADFADRMYRSPVPIVVVSTEIGMGVPSDDPAAQLLLKVMSSANQILAQSATSVVLMVSGLPLKI
jgi:adenosylcobinamide kinase / adenosylcobinamide-phosphate guanylyltransferase